MNEEQRNTLNSRVGHVSSLFNMRARPNFEGEWVSMQQMNVESEEEGAFNGFALNERVVVLRPDEIKAMLGEELDPEGRLA